jgi:ribosomal protein S18 acetylase RimI-like enzyme
LVSASVVIEDFRDWWNGSELVGKMPEPDLQDHVGTLELIRISVYSAHQGRGYATQALRKLTDLADSNGITIRLTAAPVVDVGVEASLSKRQLVTWYRKHGFKVALRPIADGSTVMLRAPRRC